MTFNIITVCTMIFILNVNNIPGQSDVGIRVVSRSTYVVVLNLVDWLGMIPPPLPPRRRSFGVLPEGLGETLLPSLRLGRRRNVDRGGFQLLLQRHDLRRFVVFSTLLYRSLYSAG